MKRNILKVYKNFFPRVRKSKRETEFEDKKIEELKKKKVGNLR